MRAGAQQRRADFARTAKPLDTECPYMSNEYSSGSEHESESDDESRESTTGAKTVKTASGMYTQFHKKDLSCQRLWKNLSIRTKIFHTHMSGAPIYALIYRRKTMHVRYHTENRIDKDIPLNTVQGKRASRKTHRAAGPTETAPKKRRYTYTYIDLWL